MKSIRITVSAIRILFLIAIILIAWDFFRARDQYFEFLDRLGIRSNYSLTKEKQLLSRDHRAFTDHNAERFFTVGKNIRLCNAISDFDDREINTILDDGIDLNQQEKNGMTILFWAFLEGNLSAFEKLLDHGAKPDLKITEDFVLPCNSYGFEFGASREDTVIFSTLYSSILCYRHRFLGPALKHSDNPTQINKNGLTLLHAYFSYPICRNDTMLKQLIDAGATLDAKDKEGRTAIKRAFDWDYPELCLLLLDAGANPAIPDREGQTLYDVVNKKSVHATDEKRAAFDSLMERLQKDTNEIEYKRAQ